MTLEATLQRLEQSNDGTFGHFVIGELAFFSGELPWRGNAPSVSCIPPGAYRAIVTFSPRFGCALYLLAPTDPRTAIRVHPANLMGDSSRGLKCQLNGCIALGERLGWIGGQKAILLSRPAVRRLQDYTGGRPFNLAIRGVSEASV